MSTTLITAITNGLGSLMEATDVVCQLPEWLGDSNGSAGYFASPVDGEIIWMIASADTQIIAGGLDIAFRQYHRGTQVLLSTAISFPGATPAYEAWGVRREGPRYPVAAGDRMRLSTVGSLQTVGTVISGAIIIRQ